MACTWRYFTINNAGFNVKQEGFWKKSDVLHVGFSTGDMGSWTFAFHPVWLESYPMVSIVDDNKDDQAGGKSMS